MSPHNVLVDVDGVAASAGSLAIMGADEIRVNRGAFLMIHNPHVCACGASAAVLRDVADTLEKMEDQCAAIYAARSGMERMRIRKMMADETWLDGEDAVEAGLADSAADTPAAQAAFDLSFYAAVPEPLRGVSTATRKAAPRTPREFEAFLRDAGRFSREAAKAIAAGGFKAAAPDSREETGGAPEGDSAAAESLLANLLTMRCDFAARNLMEYSR